MHNYSITNTKIRVSTISFIAIIGVLIAFGINSVIPDWGLIKSVSPFLIFGFIYWVFNIWLWKILNSLLKVPDFNGEWKGRGKSLYNDSEFDVLLKIRQTFTKINIDATFDQSYSESFIANVDSKNPDRHKLFYSYQNRADADTQETLTDHTGSIELYKVEDNKIEGNYFTNREPQTKGTFSLIKS